MSNTVNQNLQNSAPINSYIPQNQTNLPTQTHSPQTATTVVNGQNPSVGASKGSNSCIMFGAIGCIILLILCCVCSAVVVLVPSYLVNQLPAFTSADAKAKPDNTYSSVENINLQIPFDQDAVTARNDAAIDEALANGDSTYTSFITEEEIMKAALTENTELKDIAQFSYLKIADNKMTIKIKADELIKYVNTTEGSKDYGKSDLFKGMYLTVIISSNAAGNKLEITEISTGNSLIDPYLIDLPLDDLNNEINNGLFGSSEYSIKSFKFEEGKIVYEAEIQ